MTVLQVLMCENTRSYAAALRRMLEHDGDIAVQAVCATAGETVAALPRLRPDLVTMDLELPGGLAAVTEIMSSRPLPILVLSANVGPRGAVPAALGAGALDALAKDDLDLRDPAGAFGAGFRQRVKALSRARLIRHPPARLGPPHSRSGLRRRASVIGVCVSVGGPQLLMGLLSALPADYPIPLLIVQHITAGFTDGLVRWLDQAAPVPVGVAEPGMRAAPGAWLAPQGSHLVLTGTGQLALDRYSVTGPHRPSGDVLFRSIATVAGRTGVALVLSGMGRDGAAGAAVVRGRGGLAVAQDEQSSAIFGMPKAAIGLGVDVVLAPDEIAACLRGLRYEPLPGAQR